MAESSLFPTALDSTNLYEVVARLSTTLTADITAATTTIPLASTTRFPTAGYIVIDNETIKYISVSVSSVDATGGRGHAGTAAAHTDTTQVLVAVTAAVFNKLRAGLIAVQTYIGISGSTNSGFITTAPLLKSKLIAATRDVAAGSGNVVYTGVGFTPTSIMCIASITSTNVFSTGFADSLTGVGSVPRHSSSLIFDVHGSLVIAYLTGTDYQYATVVSYNADGFTLAWTKGGTPTGTLNLRFLCFR